VVDNINVATLYEAPLMLERSHLGEIVCKRLSLPDTAPDLTEWTRMVKDIYACEKSCTIALVGKYVKLHDAYLSVAESLFHGGIPNKAKVNILWIDSEELESLSDEEVERVLAPANGLLVPGGFGQRGTEGKIRAIAYARRRNLPFLGICLGLQLAVIEFARHVLGLEDADSGEFRPDGTHKVIDIMEYQKTVLDLGGTMRLGKYPCNVLPNTVLYKAYGMSLISERHRHRYEFNNHYRDAFAKAGMVLSGLSPDGLLVEAVELADHPYFVAVQYHPEFQSRPNRPHPLFTGLIRAALRASESV
jgi:CTP synthase